MGKFFGTDGIRGMANLYPMTVDVAMNTGRAVARFVRQQQGTSAIIGRDTRQSGAMFESALAAGLAAEGIDVYLAGVIPTPAVAYLASHTSETGAGIVISASHNPYYDNGIKLFDSGGFKLSIEDEAELERYLLELISSVNADRSIDFSYTESQFQGNISEPGSICPMLHAREKYVDFLTKGFSFDNAGKSEIGTIVVDCANGASSEVAKDVFLALGFKTIFIHNRPDGKNINENCGSQHTEDLSAAILDHGASVGLAFDGDADRLIAMDEKGNLVTGDKILAICACHALSKDRLPRNRVVSTVMSNIGLGLALAEHGIHHEITGVGDRLVMAAMEKSGAVMGGEDSGHMIFSQYHTTGDGILTALQLLTVMVETGNSLFQLAKVMRVYPQILKNVTVRDRHADFMSIASIAEAIDAAEKELAGQGRVLVRYSGTQPLLRVMVEGRDAAHIEKISNNICSVIQAHMGK